MKKSFIAALAGAMLFTAAAAEAQTVTRVRGTVSAMSGDSLTVRTTAGNDVAVQLTDKTNFVFAQPMQFSEIKQGDFLGVTSLKRKDGVLAAYDVRRFAKPVNPGHRPFDGGENQTMTNAAVSATVSGTEGRELTLTYEGGTQKVRIAETAAITNLVPGQRAQLAQGNYVSVAGTAGGDGKLLANQVEFRKDPPKLPGQ